MNSQNMFDQVNKLTQLLADASLLASELQGVISRQLDADEEAAEQMGRIMEARVSHECVGKEECYTCGKEIVSD